MLTVSQVDPETRPGANNVYFVNFLYKLRRTSIKEVSAVACVAGAKRGGGGEGRKGKGKGAPALRAYVFA